jgi:peroxiredoxin
MPLRLSPIAAAAIVGVAAVTAWITWRAKELEANLDDNAAKVTLLGKAAPDFRLPALNGSPVSLADYRGKKNLVLIFWASWNNGSHAAALSLNMFYRSSHKADSDFEVVAVSVDDDRVAAQKFVSESKTPYPVLLASRGFATGTFGIRRVPSVLLIDAHGKVEFGISGYNGRMVPELAEHLGIKDYRMDMGGPNGRRN